MPTTRTATKKRPVAKKNVAKKAKKVMRIIKKKVIARAKQKAVRKILKKENVLGRVTHYYGHIGVAIVEVVSSIKVGDIVRIKHGLNDYPMTVASLQIDHQPVIAAKKKDIVGMKTIRKVPPGAVVTPM